MAEEKDYQKWRKVSGKHHGFCAVRNKKVILGPGQPDGDIAFFLPSQAPPTPSAAWEQVDAGPTIEETMTQEAGEADGEFQMKETSKGWYDVINTATGAVVNTAKLRKKDAEAMLASPPDDDGAGTD